MDFFLQFKREWNFIRQLNLFKCGYFNYKCQIIVRVLVVTNSHKEKFKLLSIKTWKVGI
jgi:hypothetical protein